jgi:hypothetical protein
MFAFSHSQVTICFYSYLGSLDEGDAIGAQGFIHLEPRSACEDGPWMLAVSHTYHMYHQESHVRVYLLGSTMLPQHD